MKRILSRGIIALLIASNMQAGDSLATTQAIVAQSFNKAALPVAVLIVSLVGVRYVYSSLYVPYRKALVVARIQVKDLTVERDSLNKQMMALAAQVRVLTAERDVVIQKTQQHEVELAKNKVNIEFHNKLAHRTQKALEAMAAEKKDLAHSLERAQEEIRTMQEHEREKAQARAEAREQRIKLKKAKRAGLQRAYGHQRSPSR